MSKKDPVPLGSTLETRLKSGLHRLEDLSLLEQFSLNHLGRKTNQDLKVE